MRLLALVGLSLIFSTPAAAAPGGDPGWKADRQAYQCILSREVGDKRASKFVLRAIPGGDNVYLRFFQPNWAAHPARAITVDVQLTPGSSRTAEGLILNFPAEGKPAFQVIGLEESFLKEFAVAHALKLSRRGKVLFDMPLTVSRDALEAFDRCKDAVLRDWGIDPVAHAKMRRQPQAIPSSRWFLPEDYPPALAREGITGNVVALLRITPEGGVGDCTVVGSSGQSALDAATCGTITKRARYAPGLDAAGLPAPGVSVVIVRWTLP